MWTYSTPRISDVFLKNPVIRPAVTLEEIRERVYSDLNIKENDNTILLTFKVVNDRPNGEYWVWERDGIYPDDITETLDDCMDEFNRIFGNVNKGDYFKSMMTAEIIESDYQDKPLVRCKWHILINTRNISKEDITNVLKQTKTKFFNRITFDSIFVNDTEFPKPYKHIWYIEPVKNIEETMFLIMEKYHKTYKSYDYNIPKKPDCFFDWPIWRINGHLPDTVDAQYVPFNKETLHKERCKHKQYYDIPDSILNKYNLYTTEEMWGFDEI